MGEILSGSFVIAVSSICCAGFTVLLAHCFRLKCSNINFCGISCTRDIEGENTGYGLELDHDNSPRQSDLIPNPTSMQYPRSRGSSIEPR